MRSELGLAEARVPLRRGKGGRKRNKKTEGVMRSTEDMLTQVEIMHVNRRTTFRNLLSLGRVLSIVSPSYLSDSLPPTAGDEGVARRTFVATDASGWRRTIATCNFPVATVSAASNQLLIARTDKRALVIDIAELLRLLLQEQQNRNRVRSLPYSTVSLSQNHVAFTERQRSELVERRVLCHCGNLLWSPHDSCCQ